MEQEMQAHLQLPLDSSRELRVLAEIEFLQVLPGPTSVLQWVLEL